MGIIDNYTYRIKRLLSIQYQHRIYNPRLARRVRGKEKIRFLFLLQSLPQWKTEQLYLSMLNHPRFEPILGITPSIEIPGEEKDIEKYCQHKGYQYTWLDPDKTLVEQVAPDVVAYQKPYIKQTSQAHSIDSNPGVLSVLIPYYLTNMLSPFLQNRPLQLKCWQEYFENESVCKENAKLHHGHGINYVVTGLPIMDIFNQPKDSFVDPWLKAGNRRRIIYAPHHTINGNFVKEVVFSTFLENGEFMPEMARKYRDDVFFVFKPHPLLYPKLCDYWGKERTDTYWEQWRTMGNSHIEDGEYIGLMKHSDALFHDCGSFTLEYMFTSNPVMFLLNKAYDENNLCSYAKEAFSLHEKGHNHEDIDNFIGRVVRGEDMNRQSRAAFVKRHLTPPHGRSACENIICSILGEGGYK